MEALTAVSAAALKVYDMCKAMQQDIVLCQTMLAKSGGKMEITKRIKLNIQKYIESTKDDPIRGIRGRRNGHALESGDSNGK